MYIHSKTKQGEILTINYLTDSVLLTTPYKETTLGCVNCAMMAASWRNFTLSVSVAPSLRSFSATGMSLVLFLHTPCSTKPNFPEPSRLFILIVSMITRVDKKEKRVSNSSIPVCKHCLQSTKYTCISLVLDSDKELS